MTEHIRTLPPGLRPQRPEKRKRHTPLASAPPVFHVRIAVYPDPYGAPEARWLRYQNSLRTCQRAYLRLRDRLGYDAAQFGEGDVFDDERNRIARISQDGRLWQPSSGATEGALLAEAPNAGWYLTCKTCANWSQSTKVSRAGGTWACLCKSGDSPHTHEFRLPDDRCQDWEGRARR